MTFYFILNFKIFLFNLIHLLNYFLYRYLHIIDNNTQHSFIVFNNPMLNMHNTMKRNAAKAFEQLDNAQQ
jgi:hypothetical protein